MDISSVISKYDEIAQKSSSLHLQPTVPWDAHGFYISGQADSSHKGPVMRTCWVSFAVNLDMRRTNSQVPDKLGQHNSDFIMSCWYS